MRNIEIGTPVIHTSWADVRPYKGPAQFSSLASVAIGKHAGIFASLDTIAPAAEAEVNLKDPRIKSMVINTKTTPTTRSRSVMGARYFWLAESEELDFYSWHKTKRDAVAECARRIAIHDWHNSDSCDNVTLSASRVI